MFVLNGAAHSVRRPTSDLDLTSIQIANNVAAALELVRMVLDIEFDEDDGSELYGRRGGRGGDPRGR